MEVLEIGPLTIVDKVFTREELEILDSYMAGFGDWGLGYDSGEYGASSASLCKSLKWDMWKGRYAILQDVFEIMQERLPQVGIKVPYFGRCLLNNFKVGDNPCFHQDSPRNNGAQTFMVYPNKVWELNWGGVTLFADKNDNVIAAANPKPGRIVIFNGSINHCGVSPTKYHQGYGRFSMAYQSQGEGLKENLTECDPKDVARETLVEYYGDNYRRLKNV